MPLLKRLATSMVVFCGQQILRILRTKDLEMSGLKTENNSKEVVVEAIAIRMKRFSAIFAMFTHYQM